jgi:hypothetical protein
MNYEKIYNDLMNDRLNKKPQRLKEKRCGFYFEGHHIIPKWMGGTGNSNRSKNNSNIVLLTAREHFLAHWLLWRIYRDRQSSLAFHKMISNNKNQNREYSSKGYEEARLAVSETNKGNKYGTGVIKVISEQQKKQHSEFMKGRFIGEKNHFFGKTHNDTAKEKIRISRIGKSNAKKKVVIKDNKILGIFNTIQQTADFIGCSINNVKHVLYGSQKTAGGYVVKYEN